MSDGVPSPARPVLNAAHLLAWRRRLHRWLGLVLAAPLLMMGTTGFILLITPTVADLTAPAAPVTGRSNHAPDIAAIIHAARAVAPNLVPIHYRAGGEAQVDFALPGRSVPAIRVFIDPGTLTVRRFVDQPDRFYRWVHSLHENLLLPSPLGRSVVGFIGLGLFCLGLLGVPIWWPSDGRWLAGLTVSRRARGYLFQHQLHGAGGIWIVGMLLLQSVSGASMAFPHTSGALLGIVPPEMNGGRQIPSGRSAIPSRRDVTADSAIEQIVDEARAAVPDAELIDLRLPSERNRLVRVFLRPLGSAEGAPAVIVTFEQASLCITAIQDPRRTGPGMRLLGWLRALHAGDGLGPAWRIAVGVLGLTLPLLSVTGLAMWVLHQRNRRRRAVLVTATKAQVNER